MIATRAERTYERFRRKLKLWPFGEACSRWLTRLAVASNLTKFRGGTYCVAYWKLCELLGSSLPDSGQDLELCRKRENSYNLRKGNEKTEL
jgi:hypothetical protein